MPSKLVRETQISHNYKVKASMSVFHNNEMCAQAKDLDRAMTDKARQEDFKKRTDLEQERDGLIEAAMQSTSRELEIDHVRHIVVDGVNEIYYNAKPHAPQPEWVKLDTDMGIAQLLREKEEAEAKVKELRTEVIHLREVVDSLNANRTVLVQGSQAGLKAESAAPISNEPVKSESVKEEPEDKKPELTDDEVAEL